ncbi:PhzF family phenazine biosynthesis isomerase [Halomonas alkaliantarctica]|uniref:PhzF family phenazine biosynthesis isomerase n=1 Tax=Halomonas alkaliantarctica TaxID=232346 RepID=A0ABY8LRD1_9GAMM|nr:PhzF family phenazine biosynthesis isomerase [Halomonas alkaliantarctica]WGI26983.1 PhzF family phenazine biosynthesis isomerase [Halomonas alkaliantarctica]
MTSPTMYLPSVFTAGSGGGNPAPIWLDADSMSSALMLAETKAQGFESAYVLRPESSENHLRLRFFVPEHEMSMCGHATIGALWILREIGRLPRVEVLRIETPSGLVTAKVSRAPEAISISQPWGEVQVLSDTNLQDIARVLQIAPGTIGFVANAKTSRVKTVVELKSVADLQNLKPDWAAIGPLCQKLETTGLYPFAKGDAPWLFHARQFPNNSGYPEDAATGIAAAALACALSQSSSLLADSGLVRVRQGETMGRPSEIGVYINASEKTCWISGICTLD